MSMLKKPIPEHSPLDAGAIVCMTCGKVIQPEVVMGHREVQHLRYECRNEKTGCSWFMEKKVFVNGEMRGIRADGTPSAL